MPLFAAIAGLTGAGSSIFRAVNNANATSAASKAQQAAAKQYAANFQPYLGAGQSALAQQMQLLGLGDGQTNNFGAPNWASYVQNNPDILAAYNSYGKQQGTSLEDFGKWHWNTFGQAEVNSGDPNRVYTPYGPAGQQQGAGGSSAIDALKNSPLYQSLYHNGEQAILANASATGGLRGGNAETSLYNLGNNTLAQVYQQQLANLGSLSSLGENAAAGVGNGQLLAGQAASGGIIGSANANNQIAQSIAGIPSVFGNPQVLNAFGFGGGINPTSTSNLLGGGYNIPAPSYSPLALDTNIPVPAF